MTQQEAVDKGYKEFKGEGYTVMAHPKSCFFCKHCTDIIYDSLTDLICLFATII